MMNLRDLLLIDLGALMRGRKETIPEPFRTGLFSIVGRAIARVVLSPFTWVERIFQEGRDSDRILVLGLLSRIVAGNAPLGPALAAIPVWSGFMPLRRERLRRTVHRLRRALDYGASLSEAMSQQPHFFPRHCIDLVRAGEDSGSLASALSSAAKSIARSHVLYKTLQAPLIYLSAVLMIAFGIMLFISIKVLPVFVEILKDFGARPPAPLRMLVAIADSFEYVFRSPTWVGIGTVCGVLAFVLLPWMAGALLGYMHAGAWMRTGFLRVPLLGGLVRRVNLGHAADMLARLFEAGYPADAALDSLGASNLHPAFARTFRRMAERVREGATLGEAARREHGLLPLAFQGELARGESAGHPAEAMDRLAHLYQQEAYRDAQILVNVCTPVYIIITASGLFWVYASVFLALTSMYDAVLGTM